MPNVYDPQLLNRYAFERSNPYNNVDPDGHFVLELGLAILITMAIISGVVMIHKVVTDQATTTDRALFYSQPVIQAIPGGKAVTALKTTKDIGGFASDLMYLYENWDEEEEDDDEETAVIFKVDTTDPEVYVGTFNTVPQSEVSGIHSSLTSSGWNYVPPDGEGGGDYYCIGSGCPSGGDDDDGPPSPPDNDPDE